MYHRKTCKECGASKLAVIMSGDNVLGTIEYLDFRESKEYPKICFECFCKGVRA